MLRALVALFAPVPPLPRATTPVTLVAVPVVFWLRVGKLVKPLADPLVSNTLAGKFVSPAALPLVSNTLAGKFVSPAALPLVAKAPTTPDTGIFVKLDPFMDDHVTGLVEVNLCNKPVS